MARRTGFGVKPKQSLGQNFLVDENITKNIIRDLHLRHDDVVIEIGPGRGALTNHLVKHVKQLTIVEIDGRVIDHLRQRFTSSNITILHQDFLETDLSMLKSSVKAKLRVVGNIPYHLTSPILFKIFENAACVYDLTVMVQREVARRIVAESGSKEYGILSVFSRFYGVPTILFNVSPNCFYPKPKVTSSVVHLQLHQSYPHVVDLKMFHLVVRTAFGKRRKTLRNSLRYLPYEENTLERIINSAPTLMEQRPEQLTVEQFIDLSTHIEAIIR
ncbi:MAG: ribosomal RNA small subunit methyltransferase A [Ignavibacteria bacterium]|nr:ribosomal RNA small subunit methyltransferase A [Ignavibacteria bacterium]